MRSERVAGMKTDTQIMRECGCDKACCDYKKK